MQSTVRHRYRYPNDREIELVQDGQAWACPVCGNLFHSPALAVACNDGEDARRVETDERGVTRLPDASALTANDYFHCMACDAAFALEDEPHGDHVAGDPGDMPNWRRRRGEYVRKHGRTPDVYAALERIRREPDLAYLEPSGDVPPAIAAVIANDLAPLSDLACNAAELEAADFDGWSPLLWAAALGSADAVSILLRRGADVEHANARGERPLMWAAWGGHVGVVEVLLDAGADVRARTTARRPELSEYRRGRRVPGLAGAAGETALHWACERGHAAVAEQLVARGADVNAADAVGVTPLMLAPNEGLVRTLLGRGADVNHVDRSGRTAAAHAAKRGGEDGRAVVCALSSAGADLNLARKTSTGYETPLDAAVENNDTETARLLIELGADVNLKTPGGSRALHTAAHEGTPEMVRFLLRAGAHVNARGWHGETPLISALCWLHARAEVVTMLLDAGADPNLADFAGRTPLHHAARGSKGRPLIPVLLKAGADPTRRDKNGQTYQEHGRLT